MAVVQGHTLFFFRFVASRVTEMNYTTQIRELVKNVKTVPVGIYNARCNEYMRR